jgi:hypothetical protein
VALIASGPVSRMSVRHSPERRALIVMLSLDRLSETALASLSSVVTRSPVLSGR